MKPYKSYKPKPQTLLPKTIRDPKHWTIGPAHWPSPLLGQLARLRKDQDEGFRVYI